MNMDSSSLVKVGLFGGAAFLAYRYWFAPSTPAAPSSTQQPATAPAAPPVTGATTFNSLDSIYARMVDVANKAGVPAAGTSPDGWNVYLGQAGGPNPAPDPDLVFGAPAVAAARSGSPMNAAQYWSKMAPYLAATAGLSGLGVFGNLAVRMRRGGW